jgi:hypothetical protein
MATACWRFIVANATPPEPAPMLDISSLQATNKEIHPHLIHKCLWMRWGQFQVPSLYAPDAWKGSASGGNYIRQDYECRTDSDRSDRTLTFRIQSDGLQDVIMWKDPLTLSGVQRDGNH